MHIIAVLDIIVGAVIKGSKILDRLFYRIKEP